MSSYLVQAKALKKATLPTSMLTFEVYSDATCTTLVDSQQVAASAVFIEQVKGLRLRGGAAPAKALRLSAALDVDAGAYVKVTGTGVVPVGAACQIQNASSTSVFNDNSLTTLLTEVTQIVEATPLDPVVEIVLATLGGDPDLDPDRVCFLVSSTTQGVLGNILDPLLGGCSVTFDEQDGWMLHSELGGLVDPLVGLLDARQICEAQCLSWDDGETD
jgi:hypothetical protein